MPRGRKIRPFLWKPKEVDAILPVGTCFRGIPDSKMEVAIDILLNLNYNYPPTTMLHAAGWGCIRFAVADVVRRKYNINIQIVEQGKPIKGFKKKQIRQEGLLLTRLLNMILDVHNVMPCGYPSPAEWWIKCLMDLHWLHVIPTSPGQKAAGKLEIIKQFQTQTGLLMKRQNPFANTESRKRFADTATLFDAAIALAEPFTGKAEDQEGFYYKQYAPYIEARSALTKLMKTAKIHGSESPYIKTKSK